MHGEKGSGGHFDTGITKEMYKLAYNLVLHDDLYLSMRKEKEYDFDFLFENGVSKICRILQTIEYVKTHKPRKTKTELRRKYNNLLTNKGNK